MRIVSAWLWITAAVSLLACSGCGFKGPLYLPERNGTVVTHPAQSTQNTQPASSKKGKTSSHSGAPAPPPLQSPPPASPPR